ncbi:MAG: glycine betaine/L-proline ABC transporter ATP-binding protein [Spirochaetaceae bacterium]|nr:MAG: glycine betaine/L-proline ABC transporter ATP-binding protein [Spirochaetaceae bacterium]
MSDNNSEKANVKISLRNVYKVFGKNAARGVELSKKGLSKDEILEKTKLAVGVSNVSFDVYEGETLVVMGLSGSGKSTLIRCVNRIMDPTAGEILIDDVDITKLNDDELREVRRKKFSMVFQSFALFPHRRVIENVEYGLEIQGVDKEVRREKAETALKLVGLDGWGDYYPENLSGGMKQRVGLARALSVDPDILLMDEAFSALDPLIRSDMQDELIALNDRVRKTILFITHDLDEALKMGDRIVLMKDGYVVQIGTPEEILTNPADEYVQRFVANVDITKVLTAQDVMKIHSPVAFVKDGPRVALRKMKEHGLSGMFVVKSSGELVGHLTADKAAQAAKNEDKWLDQVTDRDSVLSVPLDQPVRTLFPMVESGNPIAVVDEDHHFKGVIVRGSILAALAESHSDSTSIDEPSELASKVLTPGSNNEAASDEADKENN